MTELFGRLQHAGPVWTEVADPAWLQALLDVEVALAFALADCGLATTGQAEQIARSGEASAYSLSDLGAAATGAGNPVVPLVAELRRRVGEPAASAVHHGATSQDVLDTTAMLVARRALDAVLVDAVGAQRVTADLAATYAAAVQPGRTLLQQAAPTTFGLTAAGWLAGLLRAQDALLTARADLTVQYGGAVGTLAVLGADGPRVVGALARRLDLAAPDLPWHTERTRIAGLAGALGLTAGAVATVARTITLLAQSEVGEVAEVGPAGSGGSSTMPQKQNPIAAVLALAAAAQTPGLVSTVLAAMGQEHQRAAGGWHAEWPALRELLASTGAAVYWLRTSLERLQVDDDRMARNAEAARETLAAERLSVVLAPTLGRAGGQAAVARAARRAAAVGSDLVDVLAADPDVGLTVAELRTLTEPGDYLGSAGVFIERVLTAHRRRETQ